MDRRQEPHAEPRRPHRQGRDSVVHRRQPGHQVRLRRQDLAARRLRLGHARQRQVEGLRQLGLVLRHLEARDAARPVRLRALGDLLLHARHLRLAGDPVRAPAGVGPDLPRHLHRAGRFPACRQRARQLPDRSGPEADPDARIHARPRSRAVDRRSRSACAGRTSGSIAPSKTPACWCPASARCTASPIRARASARTCCATSPAARPARTSRSRRATTTASSSGCASGLSNSWSLTTSYLYSRLRGNYSGLTSSDENNRNSPSVNRFFDGQYNSFDRHGQPVFGPLQTDRPHLFEVQGTYDLPWGTGVGVYWLARDRHAGADADVARRASRSTRSAAATSGRTPAYHADRLRSCSTTFKLGGQRFNFGLNVANLFDQDIVTRTFTTPVPRRLQRDRPGILQRHVRSACDRGSNAGVVSARFAVPAPRPVSEPAHAASERELDLLAPGDPAVSALAGSRDAAAPAAARPPDRGMLA